MIFVAVVMVSCRSGKDPSTRASPQPSEEAAQSPRLYAASGSEVQVEMANVDVHLDPELVLHIRHLEGRFLPTRRDQPPNFDEKLSYLVAIDSAEVGISMASMSHAMNTYVFGEPDAPLKNLKLSQEGSQLKQTGTLKKGIGIPFETVGTMSATGDGKIRIHTTQIKAARLPVKGLLKLFGLDMAKLINTRNTRGVTVDDNDILVDPALMLPPPKLRGRITSVRVQDDEIIQTFGTPGVRVAAPSKSSKGSNYVAGANFIAYRGGVLRFGKLTMNNADMRLVDSSPADPFDFFPDHYKDQLVAGYSKTTAAGGLVVYMVDYNKLPKSPPAH